MEMERETQGKARKISKAIFSLSRFFDIQVGQVDEIAILESRRL